MTCSKEEDKMSVIGIIGGMGVGKSTVVALIRELTTAYIINADDIGHEILKKGNPAYKPVLEAFGPQILGAEGEINRRALGKIVFSDGAALAKLNQISHPMIYNMVKEEIQAALKQGSYRYIIVDAALLIEIGLTELVDQVWGVYAPKDMQINRIMMRNGLSKEEARERILTQLPWDEIKKVVDIEINNTGSISSIKEQIKCFLEHN